MVDKKGIISEDEWDEGIATSGSEKTEKIEETLGKVGKGGIDMSGILKESGLKWAYGAVQKMVDAGIVERKKIGKKYYYRLI